MQNKEFILKLRELGTSEGLINKILLKDRDSICYTLSHLADTFTTNNFLRKGFKEQNNTHLSFNEAMTELFERFKL